MGQGAAEMKRALKAVYKRLYAERISAYAARSEEATEGGQQQECI